jgi:hypothetical protein
MSFGFPPTNFLFDFSWIYVTDGHADSGSGKSGRNRSADSTPSAGDECDPAYERKKVFSLIHCFGRRGTRLVARVRRGEGSFP